jgi:hypothetical protein
MGVILEGATGESVNVNWWNWRPTVAILTRAGILPEGERSDNCANGLGASVSEAEARAAAKHVEDLVKQMAQSDRVLMTGEFTDIPKTTTSKSVTEWTDADLRQVYSATRAWLEEFHVFCAKSGGFKVW